MFKVEIYKIRHSMNILFLFLTVAVVALFLGSSIAQMPPDMSENLLNVALISSSAVLMLYFAVLASIYISRDYMSNNYRVLVGTGISRKNIILTKFFVFLLLCITLIAVHTLSVCAIPLFMGIFRIGTGQIIHILLSFLVYCSIISTIFFLAIISQTILRSIIANIIYIIFVSLSTVFVSESTAFPFAFPLQSLQLIGAHARELYPLIALVSSIYTAILCVLSYLIFIKQEL